MKIVDLNFSNYKELYDYFDELTKEITANLTIFKYNTSSSLLEEYSVQFTISFGYIISYPYIVYTVSSANYEYR